MGIRIASVDEQAADGRPEVVAGVVAVERLQYGIVGAREDLHAPRVRPAGVVERRAHHIIRNPIHIGVADPSDRVAELVARGVAIVLVDLCAGLPVVDEHAAGVGAVAVLLGSADGELIEAVAIQIPNIRDRESVEALPPGPLYR